MQTLRQKSSIEDGEEKVTQVWQERGHGGKESSVSRGHCMDSRVYFSTTKLQLFFVVSPPESVSGSALLFGPRIQDPWKKVLRPALRKGGAPGFSVQAAPTTAEDCGGKRPASVGRPGALQED